MTSLPPETAAPAGMSDTNKTLLTVLFVVYVLGLAVFCIAFHPILFAWPAGIVTGNLIASAIWAPLAVVHLDRLARKHHREHLAHLHHIHLSLLDKIEPPA